MSGAPSCTRPSRRSGRSPPDRRQARRDPRARASPSAGPSGGQRPGADPGRGARPSRSNSSFTPPPWHARLRHDRNWHVFQAVLDGAASRHPAADRPRRPRLPVQRHESPRCPRRPARPAGAVRQGYRRCSLGTRFKQFGKKEVVPTENGRFIYRVEAEGIAEITGNKGAVEIPMTWIYYLIADPSGRRMSFVFAVETSLLPQMEERPGDGEGVSSWAPR